MIKLRLLGKILLSFAVVTVLLGVVTAVMGVYSIQRSVRHEARAQVSSDLRVAWLILKGELARVRRAVAHTAAGTICHGVAVADLGPALEKARRQGGLDYLVMTDAAGRVLARSNGSPVRGDDLSVDPTVAAALEQGTPIESIEILRRERLSAEGGDLARRAHMAFRDTPKARPRPESESTSGMVLQAVVPAVSGSPGRLLVGGVLLNRNYVVVDRVKKLVFGDRSHAGREIGTVTIFQWDVRISTNVTQDNGNRAIETRVSREVHDRVLEAGKPWHDRAFVVNDWYLTAYEPILNYEQERIGMLYVGILEAPYQALRRSLVLRFGLVTAIGVTLVILISAMLARAFGRPLQNLAEASERIGAGDLSWRVPVARSDDEIQDLANAFNRMAETLELEHQATEHANAELSEKNVALETLNRNYMEMLGFVSHELKSPLSSAVLSAQALAGGIGGEMSESQKKMAGILTRNLDYAVGMIRNYLDLSRIEKGEFATSFRAIGLRHDVIDPTIEDLKVAVEAKQMRIDVEMPPSVQMTADPQLLRVVFQNLVNNAVKYGREGGHIRIGCRVHDGRAIVNVWNEGVGVPADRVGSLFKKFFRVRDPRLKKEKGTGLGLFITRDIIRRHGGDIRVESEEGQWINFVFELPLEQEAEAGAETAKGS